MIGGHHCQAQLHNMFPGAVILPAIWVICLAGTRQVKAAHMKTAAFMSTHADLRSTRTRSGFNPLVHDYENTSFYLGKLQATH